METSKNPVLVVDDDADIRMVLTDVLEAEGFEPFEAENGQQALETLEQIPRPCLVLLDLMMPVMDGWDFLEAWRSEPRSHEVPVVVISAGYQQQGLPPLDVQAYMTKPFDIDRLVATVTGLVGARI